jgi:hypothetical protein
MIGQFLSKGITTVGGFVAERVEKSEEIKVQLKHEVKPA